MADPIEPEILDASTTALARPADESSAGAALRAAVEAAVRAEAGKAAAQMETRWLEEKEELRKETKADETRQLKIVDRGAYFDVVAKLAAAVVSEGSVGTRYRYDQIADYAISATDAIFAELRRREVEALRANGQCCTLCGRSFEPGHKTP